VKHTFVVTINMPKKVTRDEARAALDEALNDETAILIMADYIGKQGHYARPTVVKDMA
jgi:hypothetical protein